MARLGQITSVRRVGYVEAESRFKIQKDGVMVKFCMHGHYRMAKEMLAPLRVSGSSIMDWIECLQTMRKDCIAI